MSHLSIDPCLNYHIFEKRYPRNTVESYRVDLTQFYDYLQNTEKGLGLSDPALSEISPVFVRSWLANLKENKASAKTINRKISALKSFFKYYLRTGVLELTPMSNIVSPKIPRRLPNYIEQKETGILFRDIDFPETWKGKTDKLL